MKIILKHILRNLKDNKKRTFLIGFSLLIIGLFVSFISSFGFFLFNMLDVLVDGKLVVAENGEITGYKMRIDDSKYSTVKALQAAGFETIASGDSFNDLRMIKASKAGFLFRSTDAIKADHPEVPAYEEYDDLLNAIRNAIK